MPNTFSPFGLRSLNRVYSGYMGGRVQPYYIPEDDSDNIFIGDPVAIPASGGASASGKFQQAELATGGTGNYCVGVMVSVDTGASNTGQDQSTYRQAFTETYISVDDDPTTLFEIQMNGPIDVLDIGKTFNLIQANAGDRTTGISGWAVDTSSVGVGNQVKLLRLAQGAGNAITDNYPIGVFCIQLHEGPGVAVQGLQAITENRTISVPSEYDTLLSAMQYLMGYAISPNVLVTINLAARDYVHDDTIPIHPQMNQIVVTGPAVTFPVKADFVITGSSSGARATDNANHLTMLRGKYGARIRCDNCTFIDTRFGGTIFQEINNVLIWTDNTSGPAMYIWKCLARFNKVSVHGWGGIGIASTHDGHIRTGNLTLSGMGDDGIQCSDGGELKSVDGFIAASNGGSGVYIKRGGTMEITGPVHFLGNAVDGAKIQDEGVLEAASANSEGNGSNGYKVELGGTLNAVGSTAQNNAAHGFVCIYGGFLFVNGSQALNNGGSGYRADRQGAFMDARLTLSQGNAANGYHCVFGGNIDAQSSSTGTGNSGAGYRTDEGGRILAQGCTISNNGARGVYLVGGGFIDLETSTFSGNAVDKVQVLNAGVARVTNTSVVSADTNMTINVPGGTAKLALIYDENAANASQPVDFTSPLVNYGGMNFNGTTTYLDTNALTGISDSKKGTIVIIARFANAATGEESLIEATSAKLRIIRNTAGNIQVLGKDTANVNVLLLTTSGAVCAAAGTYRIQISYDLDVPGSGRIAVNNIPNTVTVTTFTATALDLTTTEFAIGAEPTAAARFFSGDIYLIWADFTVALDFNTESVRNKFIDSGLIPQYLGPNGELPTGTPPALFLGYGRSDTWDMNRGLYVSTSFTRNGTIGDASTVLYGQYKPLATSVSTPPRVVTAAGAVTVGASEYAIVVNKAVGAATTVNLPASPVKGRTLIIKDGKGDAAANNITLTPAAGNIDGAATYAMTANYQSTMIMYNGSEWNKISVS